jgi:hypothetical protein
MINAATLKRLNEPYKCMFRAKKLLANKVVKKLGYFDILF